MSHIKEDKSVDKINEIYEVLIDIVNKHSLGKHDSPHENDSQWEERRDRMESTLTAFKEAVHEDDSSWWTTEDFTAIDAAIAS
jgi:uncharacterized protein (UPF0305 family)